MENTTDFDAASAEPSFPLASEEGRPRGGRANEIRLALQEEIESGKLPPGSPLDERALAARFNVSRTPVREALQQLAAHNLLRIAPRQGVYVSRLSISRVRAIMESVGELEAMCAKLAARRVDDALRAELEAARAIQAQQQIQAPPAGPAGDGSQKPNGAGLSSSTAPDKAGRYTDRRCAEQMAAAATRASIATWADVVAARLSAALRS